MARARLKLAGHLSEAELAARAKVRLGVDPKESRDEIIGVEVDHGRRRGILTSAARVTDERLPRPHLVLVEVEAFLQRFQGRQPSVRIRCGGGDFPF